MAMHVRVLRLPRGDGLRLVGPGRAALAHKMLQRDPAPPTVPVSAWAALTAFTAWRAGAGEPLSPAAVQHVALHFPSVRATI